MVDSPELRAELEYLFIEGEVDHVVETGTFDGTGSTYLLAKSLEYAAAFRKAADPQLVTIEADHRHWQAAQVNLAEFPFVDCRWGLSLQLNEMLTALRTLRQLSPDVATDGPLADYEREVVGQYFGGGRTPTETDVLRKELRLCAHTRPLVLLDAAGGIGYAEYEATRAEMEGREFFLLLDDVRHVKHADSLAHAIRDPRVAVRHVAVGMHSWALLHINPR